MVGLKDAKLSGKLQLLLDRAKLSTSSFCSGATSKSEKSFHRSYQAEAPSHQPGRARAHIPDVVSHLGMTVNNVQHEMLGADRAGCGVTIVLSAARQERYVRYTMRS